MATTTTTILSWRPQVVTRPVATAHQIALKMTAEVVRANAPKRTGKLAASVRAIPEGPEHGTVGTRLFYGKFVAAGAKPHEITNRKRRRKRALAGPGFGPVALVHHPGTPATHFVREGAETYRQNLVVAGKAAFLRGL